MHYNELSANQLRLEEMLQATRNFSIVGLVATQRRAPVGLEIGSSRQFGCTIVEAGWARAPLSNKSSAVLLALHKPFTTKHIHQTWTPPPSLQGRALAARLKGGFFDLFVCCMYLPPRPQTASKRGGYQRTVEALLEWLDERLSEQKHRTTPIVLMDANDGIGLELRAGRCCSVETQCIAAAGARREHAAGKRLREIMEKHHMRATSAEMGGPTWFGSEGQSSLIDYVWAPTALPLRCSGPLRRLAAELQLISTRQLRDHVPLGLEFDYVQLAGQPASGEREAWNADALMEGVRVGTKRSEFLAALEDRVGAEERDGLRCLSCTTQTCWTTISMKSWSRRSNVSSRKNRWTPRITQTWRRSGGSFLRSGSRPGRALVKIAFWGRRVWRVRRSSSREFAPQRSSWPALQRS